MNEFLIDCSFKQYSIDLLIQRYAILIPRYTGFTYKFYTKNVPRYAA
jgi:hypothetical protein